MRIKCPCGQSIEGTSEDEAVEEAQTHAKEEHNQELSREQALALAVK